MLGLHTRARGMLMFDASELQRTTFGDSLPEDVE
jgi:hypothetical protein